MSARQLRSFIGERFRLHNLAGEYTTPLLLTIPFLAFVLAGCVCRKGTCLNAKSGHDYPRKQAKPLKLGLIVHDSVSGPAQDQTDFRYVDLPGAGRLLVQLHWDSAKAKLGLGVDLPIGEHYQKSIAQGKAGRRVVAAIEKAGRYYIRVYAKSYRDFSNYSLKAEFKAEGDVDGVKSVTIRCESCAQNERRCTADNRCKSCVPITPTCHLWLSLPSCGDKKKPSAPTCHRKQRRCIGLRLAQRCGAGGWLPASRCRGGTHCEAGLCKLDVKPPPPPPPLKRKVRAYIMTLYSWRGQPVYHLDFGSSGNEKVAIGQRGFVLDANKLGKRIAGGQIRIIKKSGKRFALASTTRDQVGKHRWVEFPPPK
jgi:hypothetical protein